MSQKKKKIIYVITKSNWGGAQKYVYDLASHMQEAHEVIVVSGGEGLLQERLADVGVRTISVKAFQRDIHVFKEFRALKVLYTIFKEEKPDVVHLNSSKAGGLGAVAARLAKVSKIIFTVHGWAFWEERLFVSKLFIRLFSWMTVLLTHATITISKNDRRAGEWMFGCRQKFVTIYNGIEEKAPTPKEEARNHIKNILGERKISSEALWIGAISEFHKNKGLEYLLHAVDILKEEGQDVIYLLVGSGEEEKKLKELAERLGIEDRIIFTGFVPEAAQYVKAFDVFVLSSLKEGVPYVLLEAGQSGVPVVASGVGGIPEVITDMYSGILIKPKRVSELVRAIIYLIEHQNKRELFGKNLQQKVANTFGLERMVRETQKIYMEGVIQELYG